LTELYILFKLDFYPFFSFIDSDKVYFVGQKIEAYSETKRIYTYKLKSGFINACKIQNNLFILTENELIKFDYINNKVLSSLKGNFSNLACNKSHILLFKDSSFQIFDLNFREINTFKGKFSLIKDFILNSDTPSKKVLLFSVDNFDSLIIRNFEGFLPYFGIKDSIYSIIAGLSNKNFYMYFFEGKNLRWYNKISVKIIISDVKINVDDRTILIYGSSQRTFYLNLKDLMGEDIWVYNPRVLGIYYLDESFRDVLVYDNKIIAVGYSIREGEKRGVIKILNYNSGELVLEHNNEEIEDFIRVFKLKDQIILVGITKKFIGIYKLNFYNKTTSKS